MTSILAQWVTTILLQLPALYSALPLPSGQMLSPKSWYLHLQTYLLTLSLFFSLQQKVGKSVNIDGKTLKFGMNHPYTHFLRFSSIQLGGECEPNVLVIKEPSFGYVYCIFISTC